MNEAQERLAWDVKECARQLGVSESTVRRQVYEKTIPFFKVGGRNLFRPDAIREWARSREIVPIRVPKKKQQ